MKFNTQKLVLTALFAALTCVATMIIRIPTPGTGGYIHPGDALVILSGIILGPLYGFLAAGLGSCLSDFLGGYFFYVPATFLIKGLVALLTALACQRLQHLPKGRTASVICGGVIDIVLVACGYFCFEYFFYGLAAAASIPANIIQGTSGLIIALILSPALSKLPDLQQPPHHAHR